MKMELFLFTRCFQSTGLERKAHVLDVIKEKFRIDAMLDLSHYENDHLFLEGTGSMVLDRSDKIVYSLSERTSPTILNEFCRLAGYTPVVFSSKDKDGNAIYQTNVMMCLAGAFVVICLDAVPDNVEKEQLKNKFASTGKELINISFEQLYLFAGNMLQLKNSDGKLLLIMSTLAFNSLSAEQKEKLQSYNRIIHSPLDTIEACGGGSARCMIAEIFNKRK